MFLDVAKRSNILLVKQIPNVRSTMFDRLARALMIVALTWMPLGSIRQYEVNIQSACSAASATFGMFSQASAVPDRYPHQESLKENK